MAGAQERHGGHKRECGQTDDDRPVHAGVLSALVPGLRYPMRVRRSAGMTAAPQVLFTL